MDPEEEIVEDPGLSTADVVGSAGTEIASALTGEIAAATLGRKKKAVTAAIRFTSGALGSLLAQKGPEKKEELHLGRILAAGAANTIPITNKLGVPSPLATAAKTGTIAGAERTFADVVDTGEVNPVASLTAFATGGTLGGVVSKADAKYISTTRKLFGKKIEEIDEMIVNGTLTNEEVGSALSGILSREVTEKEIKKTRNRLEREFLAKKLADKETPIRTTLVQARNYLAPEKTIGKGAREGYFRYKDNMERAEALSTRLQNRVDKEVLEKPELRDDIVNYLEGDDMSTNLSKSGIAGDLRQIREIEIKAMDDLYKLFDETDQFKILPPETQNVLKERMLNEISRGYRMYDTRSYRAFFDKKHGATEAQKLEATEEVYDSLYRKAAQMGMELDEKAIRKLKDQAKRHVKHLQSMFASENRSSAKELTASLPGRFEVILDGHMPGPKERAFLGEIKAPIEKAGINVRFRIRDALKHKAQIDADISMMNALKSTGSLTTEKLNGFVPLRMKTGGGKNAKGEQLFIPAETDHAIKKLYESEFAEQTAEGTAGVLAQIFGSAVSLSKATKVIYNPPSYVVNAIGGAVAMASNGVHPFFRDGKIFNYGIAKDMVRSYGRGANLPLSEMDTAYGQITKRSSAEGREALIKDLDEMYEYGIGNASIAANEVAAAIQNGKIGKMTDRLTKPLGKLYNTTDTATRYTVWMANRNFVSSKLNKNGKLTEDQIKRIAASITNDTYQNYNRTSKTAKLLSRKGVLPPFVTFTLELFRNTTNQIKFAVEMINGDKFAKRFGIEIDDEARKALASEGRKRLSALAAILAVSGTAKHLIGGIGDDAAGEALQAEEVDDFRFFSPSYIRNKDFLATFNPKTKTGTFAATSYLLPHTTITQMFGPMVDAFMTGEDDYETERTLAGLFVNEFLGEGTFVNQNLFRAIDNRKETGKTVSDKPGMDGFLERSKFFVFETFKPGFMNEADRLIDAYKGRGDFSPSEVWMRQIGLRFSKIDMTQMAEFRIQDFTKRYSGARGNYTTNLKYKSDELSPQEIERSYLNAISEAEAVYADIEEAYNRLDTFGYSTEEKIKILKGGNVKSEDIYRIVNGMDFKPFKRGLAQTVGEQYKEMAVGKTDREIKDEIRKLKKGNSAERLMASRFERERNRIRLDERKGRNERDRLLMNMDVVTRAEMLIDMGVHRDRRLYREFRRKGVISRDVRMLLRRAR